jgi:hypothetical protein
MESGSGGKLRRYAPADLMEFSLVTAARLGTTRLKPVAKGRHLVIPYPQRWKLILSRASATNINRWKCTRISSFQ